MKITVLYALLVVLHFSEGAVANSFNSDYRIKDKRFTSFFHQRLDTWFAKNIYDFEAQMSSTEKKIWTISIQSIHSFSQQVGKAIIPSFEYRLKIEDFMSMNSKKIFQIRFLNFQKDQKIDQLIRGLLKEKKFRLGLKADNILGLGRTSRDELNLLIYFPELSDMKSSELFISFSKNFMTGPAILEIPVNSKNNEKFLYRYSVDTKINCPGSRGITQRNQKISGTEVKSEYCDIEDWEPEAFGAAAEKVAAQLFKGMNLKVSSIGLSNGNREVELIWP